MSDFTKEHMAELNMDYNDLGTDLLLIESVILALKCEHKFTKYNINASLERMMESIDQHLSDIRDNAERLIEDAARICDSPVVPQNLV